jgi:hypothetical protein
MKVNKEKEVLLPVRLLKELLRYEYETGLFYWLVSRGGGCKVGQVAGCLDKKSGYIKIQINSHQYYAHRLAWAYIHGEYPNGEKPFIDHINGKKADNRLANLKCSSSGENNKNLCMNSRNTSGISGVYREELVSPSGKIYSYWIAGWYNESVKLQRKRFPIQTFGENEAKQMATDYRVGQILLLEQNHGIKYSERHGT